MTEQGETQRQSVANITDPSKTVWVSANAGSGKTYVLSRRVIRLMLEGAKPAELLCLTFTKAAAAEMENRVFEILGEWVMLEASELKKALRGLTGKKPGDAMLERARRLFAIALDTPGGLRIQTIHAFCESLLHQFTLEANVPGYFELMDDVEQASLIAEARQAVLGGMASLDDAILDHLDNIRDGASEDALQQGVTELINKRELLREFLGEHPETAIARIFEALAVDPNDTENQLFDRFRAETGYSPDDRALLDAELHAKDGKAAKKILADLEMLDRAQDPIDQHFLRRKIFLKANNEPRASLISASFIERPGLYEPFLREQALLCAQIDKIKALKAASLTRSLLLVVQRILTRYESLKLNRGLLDYDDLIEKTARLFHRSDMASWVQYKLDSRISHVLIDEAQDTSPLQWRIVEAITSEFYAGEGAQKTIRTVFVVGDQKQSIFSFQGADPEEFNRQYRQLKSKVSQAGLEYDRIPLQVSWRSTQEILSAVDQVFSLTENARGLGRTDDAISHTANRKAPGEVIIWPLIRQPDKPEKTDWLQPPDVIADNSAEEKLATKIASEIEKWIQNGEKLPGADRPIRHGDILILVRKRDRFVPAITRELRRHNLRSAGADRLKLVEHIAIEDMIALGRFAASNIDDLALAGLLKSPLFDFSEEELFTIAHGRHNSLAESLTSAAHKLANQPASDRFQQKLDLSAEIIEEIRETSKSLPVFEFFSRLFAKYRLRENYISRLGHEVEEVLEGFFQAAIEFGERGGLGIEAFVEWLAITNPELKRSVDMKTDEIRIITTHSSKGLEAPIVFLVDPSSKSFETRFAPKLVSIAKESSNWLPVWQWGKDLRINATQDAFARIEAAAEEEYRRLLYVGMTRAADRLIICGYQGKRDIKHNHWHKMVLDGLSSEADERQTHGGNLIAENGSDGEPICWRWEIKNNEKKVTPLPRSDNDSEKDETEEMPRWLFQAAPQERAPLKPLSPSAVPGLLEISEDESGRTRNEDGFALLRGQVIHALLEILHDVPDEERRWEIMQRYLADLEPSLPHVLGMDICQSTERVLSMPELKLRSGEQVRVEIEIIGELVIGSQPHLVRGKIDRLAIRDSQITIIDYKTNRLVPKTAGEAPQNYLVQMALYRELARQALDMDSVRCMIIWTETGTAMELEEGLLTAEFARLSKG